MFSTMRLSTCLLVGVLVLLSIMIGAPAQPIEVPNPFKPKMKPSLQKQNKKQPKKQQQPQGPSEVIQEFPTNDVMKTAWKVNYVTMKGYGLVIQDAWFKKGPMDPWMQILGDARVSEIFVPYATGSPRFWDVSYDFELCPVTPVDAGPFGKLLGAKPLVVQEIRDRGIVWIDSKGPRRGQIMVLRATLNAANYRYVIEYGFQDDGVITFRCGSTGHNYATREWEGHMHNTLWRVDVNLDGPDNTVYVMELQEPAGEPNKHTVNHRPFNDGREGWLDWNPEKFTMLQVRNERRRNARNMPFAYDLCMSRMGNARHFGSKEECTQHDFWVTRANPKEIYYQKLPKYVENAESILNADVVLWCSTPGHHLPRSEDGEMKNGQLHGVTPIMWTGFDLKPRDFFDRSPYYP